MDRTDAGERRRRSCSCTKASAASRCGVTFPTAWRRRPCGALVYSRMGHGASYPVRGRGRPASCTKKRSACSPLSSDISSSRTVVLFGHSDGASIAVIYAGARPGPVRALVLEAPHVFVEPVCVASIARIAQAYETTAPEGAAGALSRRQYRLDVPKLDRRGSGPVLQWNIEEYLPSIDSPVLVVQGEEDDVRNPQAGRCDCDAGQGSGGVAGAGDAAATRRTPIGRTRCSKRPEDSSERRLISSAEVAGATGQASVTKGRIRVRPSRVGRGSRDFDQSPGGRGNSCEFGTKSPGNRFPLPLNCDRGLPVPAFCLRRPLSADFNSGSGSECPPSPRAGARNQPGNGSDALLARDLRHWRSWADLPRPAAILGAPGARETSLNGQGSAGCRSRC